MKRIHAPRATYTPGSVVIPSWLYTNSPMGLVPGVVLALNDMRAWAGDWPAHVSRTQEALNAYVVECLGCGHLYGRVPVYYGKGIVEWSTEVRLERYSATLKKELETRMAA